MRDKIPEEIPYDHSGGVFLQWIDTSRMIADPLTEAMSCKRLARTLAAGTPVFIPTEERLHIKQRSNAVRKKERDAMKPKDFDDDARQAQSSNDGEEVHIAETEAASVDDPPSVDGAGDKSSDSEKIAYAGALMHVHAGRKMSERKKMLKA